MSDTLRKPTEELTQDWQDAAGALTRAETQVCRCKTNLCNAVNTLGKHLDPGDQKTGETICIWVRIDRKTERVVESTKGDNTYHVHFRPSSGKPT